MKKAKTFRFSPDVIEYLESSKNQTELIESAIRNTKAYHDWCKKKSQIATKKKQSDVSSESNFPYYLL